MAHQKQWQCVRTAQIVLPKKCIQTINAETTVSFDGDVDALLESIFDGEFAMATAA